MSSAKQRIWSGEMEDEKHPAPFAHLVGGIKIKELDWTEYEGGLRSRRFGLDYFIMPSTMIEKYRVNLANEYTDYAPTIEDAKKIAQDDFERIVKKVVKEDTPAPETRMAGWTEVTPNMPFEVLKSITVDNQVLAYERGRYFNAWLTFDEYEGGWCWVDDNDSEPTPSHYRPLSEVALTTEGQP